jgi:hypothetical protein
MWAVVRCVCARFRHKVACVTAVCSLPCQYVVLEYLWLLHLCMLLPGCRQDVLICLHMASAHASGMIV